MSEEKSHIAVRVLKVFGWLLLSILVLIGILRLILFTGAANNFAKEKIISIANERLHGNLKIESLKGDLWKRFSAENIHIVNEDTLISVDTLSAEYNILSLLNGSFEVNDLLVSGLKANIHEEENEQFNVQQLVKTDTTQADTPGSGFSFEVEHFTLKNSSADVYSPTYLPDSSLQLNHLNAEASFGLSDEFFATLSSLEFNLVEGRLPEAVGFQASGAFQDQQITLQDLIVETGRSVISAEGKANLADSTLNSTLEINPLSLADIQPYLENELPQEEFNITLNLAGSMDSLQVNLEAEGAGFNNFLVTANLSVQDSPVLNQFRVSAKNVEVSHYNPEIDAEVGEIQLSMKGRISNEIKTADMRWEISLNDLHYEEYTLQKLVGSGTLQDEKLLANVQLQDGSSEIIINPTINNVFAENPDWEIPISLNSVDPYLITQNPELSGSISLYVFIKGTGLEPSKQPWSYSLHQDFDDLTDSAQSHFEPSSTSDTITIAGQRISDLAVNGNISRDSVTASGHIQLIQNSMNFEVAIADYQTKEPTFEYYFSTFEFNTSEIVNMEHLPSSINFVAQGEGRYFDPQKMELAGNIGLDSSFVNGAPIEELAFSYQLKDELITIPDGHLESEIAEGSFSALKDLAFAIAPEDELHLDFQIKNLQPLAKFLNVDIFQAEGRIQGEITQNGAKIPHFDGNVELNNLQYDSLFVAEQITGNTTVSIDSTYNYDIDLDIVAPTISGVTFQDVAIRTTGFSATDTLVGNLQLDIQSRDAGDINQAIQYAVNPQNLNINLTWNALNFETPARLLSLQKPFHLSYSDQILSTDTLNLTSESGAFLNLAIPTADSLEQQVWVEGENFDFGVIQEIIFGKRFVDGVLMGEVEAHNAPDTLAADGSIQINRLNYMDANVDSLEFSFEIQDERLTANGSLSFEGEEKVAGTLDVPFLLGNPANFEDAFFEEPVSGSLQINPVELSRFERILEDFDITETTGIISFRGNLDGTAGEPLFNGKLTLDEPTLSGIKLDSAFAQFSYDHIAGQVLTLAEIRAQGQKAASIHTELPISFDFQTFELITPDDTDTIVVDLVTEDFNISVFNDFLNSNYMTNLQGVLNADVTMKGPLDNLIPEGSLRLNKARVNVPVAGILVNKINAQIDFTEQGLHVQRFAMESGSGRFNLNGLISLDGINPEEIDLTATAEQFKLANTDEYNMTIDLDTRLSGSPLRPTASGKLTVRNGFIYLQDFGERSVEDVSLEGEEESTFSVYDSLTLDMQFVIDRNFYVRNDRYLELEVELTGDLNAQKELGGDLQLFGSLSAEDGYARPLGKNFELEEGEFTFSGPLNNPALVLRTSYIPQTSQKEGDPIVLYYIIEGTAQDPVFRFESDPQMEQQDIIAYTLFGRPFYALDSWQQVVSGEGGSPANLLVDVLLDEVEALATRELGIDVVQIDNTRSGSDAVTSIKTGWYLNRRTFFSVVNEISTNPKTLFILEYMLKENLDLIITQGDDNRQGIDIRWQYEY